MQKSLIVDLLSQVNSVSDESIHQRSARVRKARSPGGFPGPLKPALAVMARAPRPGKVKTRLCPPLNPEQAAEFYECVLRDVLSDLAPSERWDTWVAYAENSRDYFLQLPEPGMALLPQRGDSLGERMHAVFVDLCHAGYRQVVLVGSDIPTLKAASIERACEVLEQHRSDLGPRAGGRRRLLPDRPQPAGAKALQRHRLEHRVGAGADPGQGAATGTPDRDGARHLRRRRGEGHGAAPAGPRGLP